MSRSVAALIVVGLGASACSAPKPASSTLQPVVSTTRVPGTKSDDGPSSLAERPEVQITFCVENATERPDIVREARSGLRRFLEQLANPDGETLPADASRPSIGVTVRPMTSDSFQSTRAVDITLPKQEALVDGEGQSRKPNDVKDAQDARETADQQIAAARKKLESPKAFGKATDQIELTGCGGRAAGDFGKTSGDREHVLVLVTGGITKELRVGNQNKLRLNGAQAFAMLPCSSDDARAASVAQANDVCNQGHCAVSLWMAWSGIAPDRSQCSADEPSGHPLENPDVQVFEEEATGDWDNLIARLYEDVPGLQTRSS